MKKIPIGVDDFKKLIENNAYYIDKTKFIADILNITIYFLVCWIIFFTCSCQRQKDLYVWAF